MQPSHLKEITFKSRCCQCPAHSSQAVYLGLLHRSNILLILTRNYKGDVLSHAQGLGKKILETSFDFLITFQSVSQTWDSRKHFAWRALLPLLPYLTRSSQNKNNGSCFQEWWGRLCLDYPLVQSSPLGSTISGRLLLIF